MGLSEDVRDLATSWSDDGDEVAFLSEQFDRGLAWVHFRPGCGGRELPAHAQSDVDDALAAAGAPSAFHRNALGVGMVAPTIHEHGTTVQCDRYLRPLFTGEEIWCQLFSEPGAGSDLAAVATRATPTGDGRWRVNGQKIWTSLAHVARWGLLLARTDPEVPKHVGMTMFIVDLHARGVDVRPLFQLTGDAEFNEVYLDDVVVPDGQRLGAVGDGWGVTRTTLLNERVAIGGRVPAREDGLIGEVARAWRQQAGHDAAQRVELAQLWIEAEVLRLTNIRLAQERGDAAPGPEGFISKVVSAAHNQAVSDFGVDLLAREGLIHEAGYPLDRTERDPFALVSPTHAFLRAQANSIEGGTSDIARNSIGEHLLGLPAEPRVDKSIPWRAVRRG